MDWTAGYAALLHVRRVSAMMCHHDAVTGTERAHVAAYYEAAIANATAALLPVMANATALLLRTQTAPPELSANATQFRTLSPGLMLPVVVYNSLPFARRHPVALRIAPVPDTLRDRIAVLNHSLSSIPAQLVPMAQHDAPNVSNAYALYFVASLPPLGYATYFVTLRSGPARTPPEPPLPVPAGLRSPSLETPYLRVDFDASTGLMSSVTRTAAGAWQVPLTQDFAQYISENGNAYEFRARDHDPVVWPTRADNISLACGPVLCQLQHKIADTLHQTVRVFRDGDAIATSVIEQDVMVGPLVGDRDFVTRLSTDWRTNGTFFTDDNGLHTLVRHLRTKVNVAANYYPFIATSSIRNDQYQLTLVGERTHGIGSLRDGELEVMLHRRMLHYDPLLGLGEALNDTSVLHDRLWIHVDALSRSTELRARLGHCLNYPPVLFFAKPSAMSPADWLARYRPTLAALLTDWPVNAHLMTLRTADASPTSRTVALRILHPFGADESAVWSRPVSIDLRRSFDASLLPVQGVTPTTLTFNAATGPATSPSVTLGSMHIGSFIVSLA